MAATLRAGQGLLDDVPELGPDQLAADHRPRWREVLLGDRPVTEHEPELDRVVGRPPRRGGSSMSSITRSSVARSVIVPLSWSPSTSNRSSPTEKSMGPKRALRPPPRGPVRRRSERPGPPAGGARGA